MGVHVHVRAGMFMFASASTVATVAADGAWSDGIWLADGIVEYNPSPGLRIFTPIKDGRFRVLVADADAAGVHTALAHIDSCERWRPIHSFDDGSEITPAAYSCMLPRQMADVMLDDFNAAFSDAMAVTFNVTSPCAHRESKVDPKLGGSWVRNHILYNLHKRFRGVRAWAALLHAENKVDAYHSDGYEQQRRPAGSDFFTVLRYPHKANGWEVGWGGEFEVAPFITVSNDNQRENAAMLTASTGPSLKIGPRPDRVIVFSGQLPHRSSLPTEQWPITPTLSALGGQIADHDGRRVHSVPYQARWRMATVMQLMCTNHAYHGPYEGGAGPLQPKDDPQMLLRMGGMLLALLAVAVMRGDVRLPFGGGASGEAQAQVSTSAAAPRERSGQNNNNGRARNRRR